jgi:hypothetical protein
MVRTMALCLRGCQIAVLLAALGGLVLVANAVRPLYQEGIRFYQYQSSAESILVTRRLTMALWVLPALLGTIALAGLPWLTRRAAVYLHVLAGLALAAGVQGCVIVLTLPYGFGSGYEHVSAEQSRHLRMSGYTGLTGVLVAVGLWLAAGAVADHQRFSCRGPEASHDGDPPPHRP